VSHLRKDIVLDAVNRIREILMEKAKNRRLLPAELLDVEANLQRILFEVAEERKSGGLLTFLKR
jgi:hypothetical protein